MGRILNEATAEQVRTALHYDQETGVFTWARPAASRLKPGDPAGYVNSKGYQKIRLAYTKYCAHRLAWLYMTGEWPTLLIDHINGNPRDNRWSNLREATHSLNGANQRRQVGKVLPRGVYRSPTPNTYIAEIKVDGHKTYLGSFGTVEAAHAARLKAAKAAFGEFGRAD